MNTNLTLLQLVPFGMIATRKWLLSNAISLHRIDNALKSHKLLALTTGVYARAEMPVTWEGVVCSLQKMSTQKPHLGGLSALELLGYAQYVSSNKKTIHLYAKTKLPAWMDRLTISATFKWHSIRSMWVDDLELDNYVIEHRWRDDLPSIKVSCPEKALLELLMDVPKSISFEHADEIMQGMTSLSPKKLSVLLHACCNVKVKRLYFWLAERQNYSWSKKLDYKEFDLGIGKRVIAEKGKMNNKYNITVPEHMHG